MRKDMCAEVRIGMFKLSKKENGLNIIIVGCGKVGQLKLVQL